MRQLCFALIAAAFALQGAGALAQDTSSDSGSSRRSYGRSSRNSSSSGTTGNNSSSTGRSRRSSRDRNTGLNQGSTQRNSTAQNGAAAGDKKAADGKTPTTIKGKAPAKTASSGSKGTGGTSGGGPAVEFKMQPNPNVNILYVEGLSGTPTMNLQAVEGGNLPTRVALRNARRSKFKTLEFSLKYDPDIVQPVGVDDDELSKLLASPAEATVNARKGILRYRAELAEARNDDNFELARIQWKAVGPTSNSPLIFLNTPDAPSRVLSPDGANVLQMRDEEGELEVSDRTGLLDASVAVAPGKRTSEAIEESVDTLSALALANSITEGTAEGGVMLSLRPRTSGVRVGEDFLVDVVYANPRRAEMDMLKMTIKFDPRVLEVVDYDENNWISRGINIFDGDYHEDLPFNYHMKNVAYNGVGEIRYEMGFSNRVAIPTAGTVATIRFRAKAPSSGTSIAFDLNEASTTQATTVSFLGFNLIGTPGQRASALTGTAVAVQ